MRVWLLVESTEMLSRRFSISCLFVFNLYFLLFHCPCLLLVLLYDSLNEATFVSTADLHMHAPHNLSTGLENAS